MAILYKCPKCGEISDAVEWDNHTRIQVTGDPNGSVMSITANQGDVFHICPSCDYQSDRADIIEVVVG